MPSVIVSKLIAAHVKHLEGTVDGGYGEHKVDKAGAGESGSDRVLGGVATQQIQLTAIPEYEVPPKLDLPHGRYPGVANSLAQLEDKSIGRDFSSYSIALTDGVGASTIAELLDALYADLRTGKYNNSIYDGLNAYIQMGHAPSPPRIHLQLIARHFIAMCKAFEASHDY
jgi:hypothetical protein